MVMICYTTLVVAFLMYLWWVNLKALKQPDKITGLFTVLDDEETVVAKFLLIVIATFAQMVFALMYMVLGFGVSDQPLKYTIVILTVINLVSILFTGRVIRHETYCKRWYLVLSALYTPAELTVTLWALFYRLGGMF